MNSLCLVRPFTGSHIYCQDPDTLRYGEYSEEENFYFLHDEFSYEYPNCSLFWNEYYDWQQSLLDEGKIFVSS